VLPTTTAVIFAIWFEILTVRRWLPAVAVFPAVMTSASDDVSGARRQPPIFNVHASMPYYIPHGNPLKAVELEDHD
jgi:hypothetical protein